MTSKGKPLRNEASGFHLICFRVDHGPFLHLVPGALLLDIKLNRLSFTHWTQAALLATCSVLEPFEMTADDGEVGLEEGEVGLTTSSKEDRHWCRLRTCTGL